MVEPNEKISGFAVNPITKEKIPIYLKSDVEFGEFNAKGIPNIDAKLGKENFCPSVFFFKNLEFCKS